MKYKLFKETEPNLVLAVETGRDIESVTDDLIRAVCDDLDGEQADAEVTAYAPSYQQDGTYRMDGVIIPRYAETNTVVTYIVTEEQEDF